MCYNVNYLTKKRLEYARRLKGIVDNHYLENEFNNLLKSSAPVYFINGFNHPDVPVITNKAPEQVQLFSWGLIPFWVKDPKQAVSLSKMTLNARGEDIFKKPAFRNAARSKRCVVLIDGFFEYHWHRDRAYPYYIKMKNDTPMLLAGLWESWRYDPEDMTRHTFSIVTTDANPMMAHIHNKPKASEGPRMPVILQEGQDKRWLSDIQDPVGQEELESLLRPLDEKELAAFTVPRLQGKAGVGNSPEAMKAYNYPELKDLN